MLPAALPRVLPTGLPVPLPYANARSHIADMDADALHALMRRSGLTASDVGARIGVRRQVVNEWLRGGRPIPAGRQEALRALAAEYGRVPAPVIDMEPVTPGSGPGSRAYAMPAVADDREFDRLVATATRRVATAERTGHGWAMIAARHAAREIWFKTGRAVDERLLMGMSEGEIARRDWYAAQRTAAVRANGGGFFARLFGSPPALPSTAQVPSLPAPTAFDGVVGYDLVTGRIIRR